LGIAFDLSVGRCGGSVERHPKNSHVKEKNHGNRGDDRCDNRKPLATVENDPYDAEHQRNREREHDQQSSKGCKRIASPEVKQRKSQNRQAANS
jgi:hypothetical protein